MRPVTEVLRFRVGENCPLIAETMSVRDALESAAKVGRRPGAILLVDKEGRLDGIFTDGDLRRLILRDANELSRPIRDVMTRSPRTMPDSSLVRDAVRMFREWRADEIPVVDSGGKPVGILDVQDLIAMKLVKD
jgi:arabinose-5-phosphate isomerase